MKKEHKPFVDKLLRAFEEMDVVVLEHTENLFGSRKDAFTVLFAERPTDQPAIVDQERK